MIGSVVQCLDGSVSDLNVDIDVAVDADFTDAAIAALA